MADTEVNGVKPHPNGTVPIVNGHTSYSGKHQLADHFIGGNRLQKAPPSAVKDFVTANDGHTVIQNVRASLNCDIQRKIQC
jgi:acetyl-CoA carboxylase / biotin carboxylase 1